MAFAVPSSCDVMVPGSPKIAHVSMPTSEGYSVGNGPRSSLHRCSPFVPLSLREARACPLHREKCRAWRWPLDAEPAGLTARISKPDPRIPTPAGTPRRSAVRANLRYGLGHLWGQGRAVFSTAPRCPNLRNKPTSPLAPERSSSPSPPLPSLGRTAAGTPRPRPKPRTGPSSAGSADHPTVRSSS